MQGLTTTQGDDVLLAIVRYIAFALPAITRLLVQGARQLIVGVVQLCEEGFHPIGLNDTGHMQDRYNIVSRLV